MAWFSSTPKCKVCGAKENIHYGGWYDRGTQKMDDSVSSLSQCLGCNEYFCDEHLSGGRCAECEKEKDRQEHEKWEKIRQDEAERKAREYAAKPDWQKQIDKKLQAEAEQKKAMASQEAERIRNERRCNICGRDGKTQCRICKTWNCGESNCIYLGVCKNCATRI